MKIYTKTGDAGETSLADGSRVPKDHIRAEAVGGLDELNAHLGLVRAICPNEQLLERVGCVQNDLFRLGAEIGMATKALPERTEIFVTESMVVRLEGWIDEAVAQVPPLTQFILPGGSELAARLHVARTVCRRAERRIVTLSQESPVSEATLRYVNRLSDLLYVWARWANALSGGGDVPVQFNG